MPPTPRHPIYVISKGRADCALTAQFLIADGVPFRIVVEPQEAEAYAAVVGAERVLVLPFSNLGRGSIPARNWVWEHAKESGAARHWILDDNIKRMHRRYKGKRVACNSAYAFAVCEDVFDRYENIAIGGINYSTFIGVQGGRNGLAPVYANCRVYSCLCIDNSVPLRWRGRYNEDMDLCLQVLASGWCTLLVNAFGIDKAITMTMKGGNSDELYKGDGRLTMARSLERVWPHVVETRRRFGRPQHAVRDSWRKFDTPLRLKPGIDPAAMVPNEYGMQLVAVAPVKSPRLQAWLDERAAP